MTDTEQKVWIIGVCEDDPSDMKEVCQMISREMQERAVLRRYGTTEEWMTELNWRLGETTAPEYTENMKIIYIGSCLSALTGRREDNELLFSQQHRFLCPALPGSDAGLHGFQD